MMRSIIGLSTKYDRYITNPFLVNQVVGNSEVLYVNQACQVISWKLGSILFNWINENSVQFRKIKFNSAQTNSVFFLDKLSSIQENSLVQLVSSYSFDSFHFSSDKLSAVKAPFFWTERNWTELREIEMQTVNQLNWKQFQKNRTNFP